MSERLSVIIAVGNAQAPWGKCLAALAGNAGPVDEVILVSNAPLIGPHPGVRTLQVVGALVPVLWERGIRETGGEWVALLSADCVPAPGWAEAIRTAHREDVAGVGGAIAITLGAGLSDRALHFCRYSRYMPPFARRETADFAADNASYKRAALVACEFLRSEGFWEPAIHAEMIRQGARLVVDPAIAVELHNSIRPSTFVWQRFKHGRQFGCSNAGEMSIIRRVARIIIAPLIPLVMITRVAREVIVRRRHAGWLVLASPVLALFFIAWAAGECTGYFKCQNPDSK